jgi:hypothetical protein
MSFMWMKPGYFFSISWSSRSAVWDIRVSQSVDMQIRYGTIWNNQYINQSIHQSTIYQSIHQSTIYQSITLTIASINQYNNYLVEQLRLVNLSREGSEENQSDNLLWWYSK